MDLISQTLEEHKLGNYVYGVNSIESEKVADAMIAQGI